MRQSVAKWLREEDADLPVVPPLDDPQPDDVLELDELWSFVGSKKQRLGLDSPLSTHPPDCLVLHWRTQ
ncbi:hypothetical protein KFU94_64635 [Chloroflexi bacterium TSY]|nr:hypothetical protein [Chloroflexi bacterium TSY]